MVEFVHLLQCHGIAISETYEHPHEAVQASADLLRWLGVEADKGNRLRTRPTAVVERRFAFCGQIVTEFL